MDLVAYVYWRQGYINLCFQLQTSFLESRLDILCSKPGCTTFHVDRLEGCSRSKVAGWYIYLVGRLLEEDIHLLDPWLSYTQ